MEPWSWLLLSDNDDEVADDREEELTAEELTPTAATELDTAAAHAISHNQTLPCNRNVQQTDRLPIGMWPALERGKGVTGTGGNLGRCGAANREGPGVG